MANTFSQLYFHIIWSTKERKDLIDYSFQDRLYKYIGGIVRSEQGTLMEIGGIANHVHLLLLLPLKVQIPGLVRQIKASSSKWIHDHALCKSYFSWQEGYGAFSVSKSMIPSVTQYILNQERHHQNCNFDDEYIGLLKLHGVEFDDKYVLS